MVSLIGGRNSASSFSEEDLMSDLIGFYMGLHQEGDSLGMNRQTIERICDVVTQGASSSRKKAIQEQILDEYNYPFQKITAWGQPRLDGWDRELDDCPSKTCSQPRRMPAEFSRILPKPPGRPYWYWDLAWATMIIEGNRYDDYLSGDDLNSRELNWSPPHLPIITR
jgi:hypothetical protein